MVVLREEGSEDVSIALLLAALQEEVLAPDHLTRAMKKTWTQTPISERAMPIAS